VPHESWYQSRSATPQGVRSNVLPEVDVTTEAVVDAPDEPVLRDLRSRPAVGAPVAGDVRPTDA
jgi:hypothetical protein